MLSDPLRGALLRLARHPQLTPAFLALATGVGEAEMSRLLAYATARGWLSEHKRCCDLPPLLVVTDAGRAAIGGM